MNDDVPDAVLGVRTDETLSANASVQEVDTSEPLPTLSGISTNTTLELAEDLRLPRLAHGLILGTLDGRAEVVVDGEQHVVDSDVGFPRRECGIGENVEHPGEVTHTKSQRGQRRVGGGRSEDGRRELWVVLGWGIPHVVLEVGRDERGMETHAGCQRCWWDEWEGVCLRDWGRGVDLGMWDGRIVRERRRRVGWR